MAFFLSLQNLLVLYNATHTISHSPALEGNSRLYDSIRYPNKLLMTPIGNLLQGLRLYLLQMDLRDMLYTQGYRYR